VKPTPKYDHTARRFAALVAAYTNKQSESAAFAECSVKNLLNAYKGKLAAWRKSEESSVCDFNLLHALQIEGPTHNVQRAMGRSRAIFSDEVRR
jgi:hypothetical protein